MKTWYEIKAKGLDAANVDIFGEIGYLGFSASHFINDLRVVGAVKNIHVRINSAGGQVFDGIAIYNALKRHEAKVTVEIYGVAASIASIVAMAGDKVIMPANTFLFIHNPFGQVVGDANDMRDQADALDKIASALQSTYMAKSGKSEKEIKKWMNEDTWFTAQEALDAGLADEVTGAVKMAANASLARFTNLPAALKPLASDEVGETLSTDANAKHEHVMSIGDRSEKFVGKQEDCRWCNPPAEDTESSNRIEIIDKPVDDAALRAEAETRARDILALCTKAGVAQAATGYLDRGLSVAEVTAKLADADKIRARCLAAKLPQRADAYIIAGMSVGEVANDLFDVLLARQGPEIDNSLAPEGERQTQQPKKTATSAEIYALRKKQKP